MLSQTSVTIDPFVPASKSMPEISIKAIILSILLSLVMGAANAYLGLKIGLTVSASIPAAVMSMAILKFFRNSNILENNIVQTAASAGEVVASGVVFTLPALVMMGYWASFPFWFITCLVCVGGTMGVLFSIPLRRAFVVQSDLAFPEGLATGEILKAGEGSFNEGSKDLLTGGIISLLFKFAQSGLMVFGETASYFFHVGRTVSGVSMGFSAVLLGAGYIVGLQIVSAIMVGTLLGWFVAVPMYGLFNGIPEGVTAQAAAVGLWSQKVRIIGVGAMVFGGIWTVLRLSKPIKDAIVSSMDTLKKIRLGLGSTILRTEMDIPITYVVAGLGLLTVPLLFVYHYILLETGLNFSPFYHYAVVLSCGIFTLVVGFICAAIAAYMTGLVGSSSTPISGVTIMALLGVSLVLWLLLGGQIDFSDNPAMAKAIAAFSVVVGAVIAVASAVSGDNLQDLKSGQVVGSTPWKQQVMLILGVFSASLVIAPVLNVLFQAYGLGDVLPREGMDPSQTLSAPKAAIMHAVSSGIFSRSFQWDLFSMGVALAILVILVDYALERSKAGFRLPIIAVALGMYLPMDISFALFIGGFVNHLMVKKLKKRQLDDKKIERHYNRGVLFCSGVIAGEAIIGILLAIPFAAYQSTTILALKVPGIESIATFVGASCFGGIVYYLYRLTTKPQIS